MNSNISEPSVLTPEKQGEKRAEAQIKAFDDIFGRIISPPEDNSRSGRSSKGDGSLKQTVSELSWFTLVNSDQKCDSITT